MKRCMVHTLVHHSDSNPQLKLTYEKYFQDLEAENQQQGNLGGMRGDVHVRGSHDNGTGSACGHSG